MPEKSLHLKLLILRYYLLYKTFINPQEFLSLICDSTNTDLKAHITPLYINLFTCLLPVAIPKTSSSLDLVDIFTKSLGLNKNPVLQQQLINVTSISEYKNIGINLKLKCIYWFTYCKRILQPQIKCKLYCILL